ncbi:PEX17 (YNL214W) [Zygosaccharomyces parabailii]|nr:PEX17 (YNL214W) [Zygosaccharomyces parabailii]CDH13420.1 related to Peroxisomal membrane protein PEX17 [Zygosaccharomyces bailii ISA1307]
MYSIDPVEWPDETKIVSTSRKNATFSYIQNLFHNAGLTMSVIYLMLKLVLVPALDERYRQRADFSASLLIRLRKLVCKLQNSLRTTSVSVIGYNEGEKTIERCTQTSEDERDVSESRWTAISKRFGDAETHLRQFAKSNALPPHQMDTFNATSRLLADRLKDEVDADHSSGIDKSIVDSVREVKGWFVSGKVY